MKKLSTFLTFVFLMLAAQGFGQMSQSGLGQKKKSEPYPYIDTSNVYLKVVEQGYRSPQVLRKLADSYYFDGKYQQALTWYEELFSEYPNTEYPEPIQAESFLRAARSCKAQQDFKKAEIYMQHYASLVEHKGQTSDSN
jgi:tetratricopeptide (TPR) repeat protein